MTWIGVTDRKRGHYDKGGLCDSNSTRHVGPLLERGTLLLEVRDINHGKSESLLSVSRAKPWPRTLAFQTLPGGGIGMIHRHNSEVIQAALKWSNPGGEPTVRVSYAWDAPNGWGRLAMERPGTCDAIQRPVHLPRPLVTDDLCDLVTKPPKLILSPDVVFAGISTDILPIGPMPSLHPTTPIATPTGYRPAGTLQRGDTVTTDTGDIVPVLHTVTQTVPAYGSFAPVRVRAPYFGLSQDIIVAPDQRLVLRGSEVEYTFGQEAVLVPARHLINGQAAQYYTTASTTEYVQMILPGQEAVVAAGCALESLYIGRIRRDAKRLDDSALAHIPSHLLPEHRRSARQVLTAFEAVTLVAQRAA
ncbi:Hint domain-containing protein [Tateyamaria sp. ANG-S1]|uniref:Hint domain-containing protein n=1 Tax=Tateyamaria sp. ANG-S1 TaxID=1577905 RepID=UPI00057EF4C7|nr:Hint domain-containing protein [Tateyamaria sp. ANG-S1]KIC49665.1 hypothetical protein RA29_08325 [Tateyamaria sp. ANG-S1]